MSAQVFMCDECGAPLADGGPCGWYCTGDGPHPKHDASVARLIHATRVITGREYDALLAQRDALVAMLTDTLKAAYLIGPCGINDLVKLEERKQVSDTLLNAASLLAKVRDS